MLEPAGTGQPFARAFLRVASASLAQHQLALVLASGCQRLICLARGPSPQLIALQHAAEDAGVMFHIVTAPQQLSALVTATDELIVVSEGLFADPAAAVPLIEGGGPVVLALPDEGAVAEGFERLDINHAAAGLMKIPGAMVERLHELPADCDAASALTRIALQAGVPMRVVPAEARTAVNWRMVRTESEALAVESEWLRERFGKARRAGVADRLARAGVLAFGSSLLHQGNASGAAGGAVVATLAIAVTLAGFGLVVPALLLAGLAWVLVQASGLLRGAERQAHGVAPPAIARSDALGWLVDLSFVAILALSTAAMPGGIMLPIGERIFSPLMLLLLVHLVPQHLPGRLSSWCADRAALGIVLAIAAGVGYLGPAVRLLAVALAIAGVILPPKRQN